MTTPVLQFVNEDYETRVTEALGAVVICESTLGDYGCEDEPHMNERVIKTYALAANADKTFCSVQSIGNGHSMCTSARLYNAVMARTLPSTKTLLSVDPEGEQATSTPRDHSFNCGYVWSTAHLLRYLKINDDANVYDMDALKAIFGTTEYTRNEMPYTIQPLMERRVIRFGPRMINFVNNNNNNNDDDDEGIRIVSFGTVQPGPQYDAPQPMNKKVKIDKSWEEQLRDESELQEAAADRYACMACVKYDKTIVLLPCSHTCYCDVCLRRVMEDSSVPNICPTCRKPFESIARIYD